MLSATSTPWAPWYVAPGDHKWFSHLATAAVVVRKLKAINPDCPAADSAAAGQMAEVKAELMAELTGRPAPRGPGAAAGPGPARRGRRPVPRSGA
jgi:hypothetical protein